MQAALEHSSPASFNLSLKGLAHVHLARILDGKPIWCSETPFHLQYVSCMHDMAGTGMQVDWLDWLQVRLPPHDVHLLLVAGHGLTTPWH